MTKPAPIPKAQQREMTRAKLIAVGRDIFARDGYAHAATEDIVNTAQRQPAFRWVDVSEVAVLLQHIAGLFRFRMRTVLYCSPCR